MEHIYMGTNMPLWRNKIRTNCKYYTDPRAMREFRGIRKDNGKWAKGCLLEQYGHAYIVTSLGVAGSQLAYDHKIDEGQVYLHGYYEVIPETIGQFVGLKGDDGKDIACWQGDKIEITDYDGRAIGVVLFNRQRAQWMWQCLEHSKSEGKGTAYPSIYRGEEIELHRVLHPDSRYKAKIIGNIWENKELLIQENKE